MTDVDMGPAQGILEEIGRVEHGHLIPLLQRIQETYGYLPRPVLLEVSRRTGLPASHLYGVATFYAQFHLQPHGRHTVRVCRGTACHVRGGHEILGVVRRRLGIEDGQTTADRRFTLETVACLGTCFLAPVVMVDHDYYGTVSPDQVDTILAGYK